MCRVLDIPILCHRLTVNSLVPESLLHCSESISFNNYISFQYTFFHILDKVDWYLMFDKVELMFGK